MASRGILDEVLLLLAVRLAQPGMLSDIVDAYERLEPPGLGQKPSKDVIQDQLRRLVELRHAWLYTDRRYMLTRSGERVLATAGLRIEVDARRLYLLKETRKRSYRRRSDTRAWPLKQRS